MGKRRPLKPSGKAGSLRASLKPADFTPLSKNEGQEPPHIHVKAGGDEAKFWLEPVDLASNYGFRAHELGEIEEIIRRHWKELMEAWDGYFD